MTFSSRSYRHNHGWLDGCLPMCPVWNERFNPEGKKQRWKFIGRDANGWMGFRCVEGPGSLGEDNWLGDFYLEPEAYWGRSYS